MLRRFRLPRLSPRRVIAAVLVVFVVLMVIGSFVEPVVEPVVEPTTDTTATTEPPTATIVEPTTTTTTTAPATTTTTTTAPATLAAVELCDHLRTTGAAPSPATVADLIAEEGSAAAAAARIARWVFAECPDQADTNEPLRRYLDNFDALEEALRG